MANEDILWDYPLTETPYGRLLLATVERVKSLNLKCIGHDKVELRKLAWNFGKDDPLQPPYVIVSPRSETTPWQEGTNERDAIGYAVMLSVVLADAYDVTIRGLGLQLDWRRSLRQSFHNKTQRDWTQLSLTGHTSVALIHSYMEAGDAFLDAEKRRQYDAQYWLVRCNVWEPRT